MFLASCISLFSSSTSLLQDSCWFLVLSNSLIVCWSYLISPHPYGFNDKRLPRAKHWQFTSFRSFLFPIAGQLICLVAHFLPWHWSELWPGFGRLSLHKWYKILSVERHFNGLINMVSSDKLGDLIVYCFQSPQYSLTSFPSLTCFVFFDFFLGQLQLSRYTFQLS